MPEFDDKTRTDAAAIQVWKILYNPMRFPEWWAGFDNVIEGDARGGPGDVTLYPEGYPDFPLPQRIESNAQDHRVVVSCTVSDLVFEWRLEPDGTGTLISVHVEIPESEAARLAKQRDVVTTSLRNLAALAESS